MNIDFLIGSTEARINRFLKDNGITVPEGLQRSVFKIILPPAPLLPEDALPREFYCHLFANRIIISQQTAEEDVSIDISLDALIAISKGDSFATLLLEKKMHMQGDIGKAHSFQHWLESLALTKEDIVSDVFGEVIGTFMLSAHQQAEPLITSILEAGKNLFQNFSQDNTQSNDDSQLKQQIIKLREKSDRLEARLDALNEQLNNPKS